MEDYIVRATAAGGQIRAFAATTRGVVETARAAHNTSPVATAALGRLLTAGAMMGVMMKGDKDLLTLQIKAGGPIDGITVTADSKGRVKGYVGNPGVMLPANSKGKLDVAGAVGPGFLNVIMDLGLKEPYSGQTMLQTSEIADILFRHQSAGALFCGAWRIDGAGQYGKTGRGLHRAADALCRGRDDCQAGRKSKGHHLCDNTLK